MAGTYKSGIILIILLTVGLASCAEQVQSTPVAPNPSASVSTLTQAPVEIQPPSTASPTQTVQILTPEEPPVLPTEASGQFNPTAPVIINTPRPTPGADDLKTLPVIPEMNSNVMDIYRRGLEMGNNPQTFSKVGDCESTPTWFLGDFDASPTQYRLGQYSDLQTVIDYYKGSFGRTSLAVRRGFKASSVFATIWADPKICQSGEGPLACEYRLQNPSVALIMMGTNDADNKSAFEPNMRKIIEFTISRGIVPILSTKADNLEGDGSINLMIARLAQEYDIPLWNFWLAVQSLPHRGLQEDHEHLTVDPNFFDDRVKMMSAWPVRNLTALQVLQEFLKSINN